MYEPEIITDILPDGRKVSKVMVRVYADKNIKEAPRHIDKPEEMEMAIARQKGGEEWCRCVQRARAAARPIRFKKFTFDFICG